MSIELVFGHVLRELRVERGLSQEQLGFASGLHRTYVSLLERGLKTPSLDTLFRLAQALEVAPSAILERVEVKLTEGSGLLANVLRSNAPSPEG